MFECPYKNCHAKSHRWWDDTATCLSPISTAYRCVTFTHSSLSLPPLYHVLSFTWAQWLLWPIYQIIAHSFKKAEVASNLGVSPLSGGAKRSPKQSLWGNDPGLNIQLCIFRCSRHSPFSSAQPAEWFKSPLWVYECETREYCSLRGSRQHWLWVLEWFSVYVHSVSWACNNWFCVRVWN